MRPNLVMGQAAASTSDQIWLIAMLPTAGSGEAPGGEWGGVRGGGGLKVLQDDGRTGQCNLCRYNFAFEN